MGLHVLLGQQPQQMQRGRGGGGDGGARQVVRAADGRLALHGGLGQVVRARGQRRRDLPQPVLGVRSFLSPLGPEEGGEVAGREEKKKKKSVGH